MFMLTDTNTYTDLFVLSLTVSNQNTVFPNHFVIFFLPHPFQCRCVTYSTVWFVSVCILIRRSFLILVLSQISQSQPCFVLRFFEIGSHTLFAQARFKP
jgi:hypothetical protein